MARISQFKSNLTSGVLDPRLKSRADIQHYANGIEIGDNMVILPFGGARRRGGLPYVYEIPVAVAGNGQLVAFSYNSTDVQYLLAFVEQRIYFFRNGAVIANINGSGNPYLASPYPISVARELRFAQTADAMVIVHPDYAPRLLVRGTSDSLWTLSTITFDFIPQIDYNDATSPTPTSEVQDVTFTGFTTGIQFKLDLEGVITEAITYDTTTASTANRIAKAIGKLWNTNDGDVTCAFQAGTTYRVTFQNGAARNYDLMTGYALSGAVTIAVASVTNGVARTEAAWSSARGWPRTVTFYEGRMVFGGTKGRPQTVFLSASTALFNFNIGEGLDDDAIMKTLDTDQVNAIQNIIPGRHLQIYTEGAEFFVPDFPITPENSNFRTQTTYGSSRVRPLQAEGATLFLDRFGRGLFQFIYNDVEAAYGAASLSRLAAHLLNSPVDMAVQKSLNDEDTNYVYVVNTDGTMAVLNTLRTEEISAWTPWSTGGHFLSVALLGEDAYFLVRRATGTPTDAWYIEHHDLDYYLDNGQIVTAGSPQTAWSVAAHLNGIDCRVRGDNAILLNRTPVAGAITTEAAVASIEIGRWFAPRVKLLPPAVALGDGLTQMRRSRLSRARVHVRQTQGLIVNGRPMPERYLDLDALDTAPAALSGIFEVRLNGWGLLQAIDFTQEQPLPLTLLAVEYEGAMN
jgi:hypothetical protein